MVHAAECASAVAKPCARQDRAAILREEFDLAEVRVEQFCDLVFVALDPSVGSLEDYLGEAAQFLRKYCTNTEPLGRVRWRYEGNWKLWHENFRDNYHPEFVHQMVGDGYKGVVVQGENHQLDDFHSLLTFPPQRRFELVQAALSKAAGLQIDFAANPAYARPPLEADPQDWNAILAVFPTFDLQYTVNKSALLLQMVKPLGIDASEVELLALGYRGESAEIRQWRLERTLDSQTSAGKVTADDDEALWRCQMGVVARGIRQSDMGRGQAPGKVGAKRDEYSLRAFYQGWHHYMGTDQSLA